MNPRRRHQGRLQTTLLVTAVCAIAAAGLLALGLYLAPRVLPNLEARVADADTVEQLREGAVAAQLTVPEGWVAHRGWGDDAELVLRTPDGELSVTVTVADAPVSTTFDARAEIVSADASVGDPVTERLASGLEVIHADAEGSVLIAAVGEGSAPSVGVVARAPADRLPVYRAAIAMLLESVRVMP